MSTCKVRGAEYHSRRGISEQNALQSEIFMGEHGSWKNCALILRTLKHLQR